MSSSSCSTRRDSCSTLFQSMGGRSGGGVGTPFTLPMESGSSRPTSFSASLTRSGYKESANMRASAFTCLKRPWFETSRNHENTSIFMAYFIFLLTLGGTPSRIPMVFRSFLTMLTWGKNTYLMVKCVLISHLHGLHQQTPARIPVQHLDARHQYLAPSGLRVSVHRHRMRNHDQDMGKRHGPTNDSTGFQDRKETVTF